MKLDTTYVVEACSLAHDLGNPPFGHYGEKILCELTSDIGGFEGNAQTFRILHRLEKKHYEYRGLNLTFRTLFGVVKYFHKFDGGKNEKFIYDEDYDLIEEKLNEISLEKEEVKTIDMQIMDLSDEIAYAAHDLEDSLSLNMFTIEDLLYEFNISEKYKEAYGILKEIVEECREFAFKGNHFSSSEEYSFLFRKELTSKIVNTLIRDIRYCPETNELKLSSCELLSEGLKKLVFRLILRKPSVQMYEKKGEIILKGLYEVYMDKDFNRDMSLLPPEYRICKSDEERRRNVVDFISGMMDQFSKQEYEKYYGSNALSQFYIQR
ncbi:Deoxyguanosinetriphosphate triphosphohydrolase [compost metagenome]